MHSSLSTRDLAYPSLWSGETSIITPQLRHIDGFTAESKLPNTICFSKNCILQHFNVIVLKFVTIFHWAIDKQTVWRWKLSWVGFFPLWNSCVSRLILCKQNKLLQSAAEVTKDSRCSRREVNAFKMRQMAENLTTSVTNALPIFNLTFDLGWECL